MTFHTCVCIQTSDVTKEATALTAYSIILSISIKIPNRFKIQDSITVPFPFRIPICHLSSTWFVLSPQAKEGGKQSGKKCPDSHQSSRLVAVEVSSLPLSLGLIAPQAC